MEIEALPQQIPPAWQGQHPPHCHADEGGIYFSLQ